MGEVAQLAGYLLALRFAFTAVPLVSGEWPAWSSLDRINFRIGFLVSLAALLSDTCFCLHRGGEIEAGGTWRPRAGENLGISGVDAGVVLSLEGVDVPSSAGRLFLRFGGDGHPSGGGALVGVTPEIDASVGVTGLKEDFVAGVTPSIAGVTRT